MKKRRRRKKPKRLPWGEWQFATIDEDALAFLAKVGMEPDLIMMNERYTVHVRRFNVEGFKDDNGEPLAMTHLSIKRNDKEVIHDWRELQRIKNEILGEDVEAVELYPTEERLIDTSNQFHLWALPRGNYFPFGFSGRYVVDATGADMTGAKQRPFENPPHDLILPENVDAMLEEMGKDGERLRSARKGAESAGKDGE